MLMNDIAWWIIFLICLNFVQVSLSVQDENVLHTVPLKQVTSGVDITKDSDRNYLINNHFNAVSSIPARHDVRVENGHNETLEKSFNAGSTSEDETITTTEAPRSNLNLAFIPILLGFVFLIAVCLKCCHWFRQYTHGGSKGKYYYAEIVEDGEEGHLDFVSDTTSTAPYDTVSSFASFLKRSQTDSTVTSAKSLKAFNDVTISPRKWLLAKIGHVPKGNQEFECIHRPEMPLTKFERERTITACTSSASEDIEVTEADPLSSSDASMLRKQNRFRVSFVTDSGIASTARCSLDSTVTLDERPSSLLRRGSQKHDMPSHLTIDSVESCRISDLEPPKMATVATQTNKTCRRTLEGARLHQISNGKLGRVQPVRKNELVVSAEVLNVNSEDDHIPMVSGTNRYVENVKENSHVVCNGGNIEINDTCENRKQQYQSGDGIKYGLDSICRNGDLNEATVHGDSFVSETAFIGSEQSCNTCNSNSDMKYMQTDNEHCDYKSADSELRLCLSNMQKDDRSNSCVHQFDKRDDTTEHYLVCLKSSTPEFGPSALLETIAVDEMSTSLPSLTNDASLVEGHAIQIPLAPKPDSTSDMNELPGHHTNSCEILYESRNTCDLVSVCTHCGRSFGDINIDTGHSHRSHSSVNSDRRSQSISSLESSGYAEELSLDGSD